MTSKILFENLKIYAYHGVLPEEKILGTYYILNVEISADLSKAAESDDLKDTINYAEINDILHSEMAISSQLLEHVIGRIINNIKNTFPIISFVKVKLTKTNPPMKGEIDGVSVEIEESFK
ncbi:dihydroneopterin aldolase [Halpernia frigidisoli]|uniref:7,8-dihydroneopterin aldolase n=1 Tax=Halpernia frigidisoli TaxID=1125876 RepID=A0A1I3D255_9FLAO|nr:dihydroneopterin aldolase [Halpernia frigidisoli]SFH80581.1 dihydroneopterin aldolase [Halpernia frigidisoli]